MLFAAPASKFSICASCACAQGCRPCDLLTDFTSHRQLAKLDSDAAPICFWNGSGLEPAAVLASCWSSSSSSSLSSSPSCATLLLEEHETRDWVPQKAALAFQPREVAYWSVTYTLFTPGTQMQSVTMMSYTRWHQQMFTQSVNKLF